jgi:hypothetical protein
VPLLDGTEHLSCDCVAYMGIICKRCADFKGLRMTMVFLVVEM